MRVKPLSVTILVTLFLTGGHQDVVLLVGHNNQLVVNGEFFTRGREGGIAQVQPEHTSMKRYTPKTRLGLIPANDGVGTP